MILQALVHCYEALAERGELEKPGWSPVKAQLGLGTGCGRAGEKSAGDGRYGCKGQADSADDAITNTC